MEIIIDVVEVDVDGTTKYEVQDHSRPGARMYGNPPPTGPFDTREEAEGAADVFRRFVRRAVRNDPGLGD